MIGARRIITWFVTLTILNLVDADKHRMCIVDGKGSFKRSQHYCPELDKPESKVECVVALDRLDCLRRLSKGTADFAVFSSEDLVTAQNAGVEILVTNELRYSNDSQEYEVVAVVDNNSGISTKYDLQGKKYCHPGYGYQTDWTRILANYFESSVVRPLCEGGLTISENRIKATSTFFASACKAGPWVNNPALNLQLKGKYPNLCDLCGNPSCSINDKYWGRTGSLLCLTDGVGDVSWSRLDDVKTLFKLPDGGGEISPDGYSYLCPDDTLMPLNSSNPCIWVVKPWSVVASRRTVAQDIQKLVSSLSHVDKDNWKYNLRNLIQITYSDFVNVDSVEPIENYLYRAKGYLKANSFSGCHPPRTIKVCTTSIIENAKCQWLRESAAVYGIEPDLDCIKADNATHCMMAINLKQVDVVMVSPDMAHLAMHKYNLKPLFYETVLDNEKYITVAVTRPKSNIRNAADLQGKKACFPVYDGVAWNSVKYYLHNKSLISGCEEDRGMSGFFGPSCSPGLPKDLFPNLRATCQDESFNGEYGALQCLTSGAGDVAFVSKNSINKYVTDESEENPGSRLTTDDFEIVCLDDPKNCHISWAPVGQAMVRSNSTDLWLKDTLDVFLQLDDLFGKNYKSLTSPFTMFGKYDGVSDLLFHDVTLHLRSVPTARDTDSMPLSYYTYLNKPKTCINSKAVTHLPQNLLILVLVLFISSLPYRLLL